MALAFGDWVQVLVTGPGGVGISGCNDNSPLSCLPYPALPGDVPNTITLDCVPPPGSETGCPAGSSFALTISALSAGPLVEQVQVTHGQASQTFIYQGDATFTGSAAATSAPTESCVPASVPVGKTTLCTSTLTSPLIGGASLQDTVTQPGGVEVTSCNNTKSTLVCLPAPQGAPLNSTVATAYCFAVSRCPIGSSLSLTITAYSAGPLAEQLQIAQGDASQTFAYPGDATFTGSIQTTAPTMACAPTSAPVGTSTVCTVTLTSPLLSGDTLRDTVTQPGGVAIADCASRASLNCPPAPPPPSPNLSSITLFCAAQTACLPGSSFTLTITATSAGALAQQLTLTEGDTSRMFTYQGQATFTGRDEMSDPSQVCTPTSPAVGTSTVCTITLTSPLASGDVVQDTVTQPAGVTISACNAAPPLTCPPVRPPPPSPAGSTSQATVTRSVDCLLPPGSGAACPAGSSFTVTISATSAGMLAGQLRLAQGTLTQTYPYQGEANFIASAGATPPTEICTASVVPLGAPASCTNTPASTAPAGGAPQSFAVMPGSPMAFL